MPNNSMDVMTASAALYKVLEPLSEEDRTRVLRCVEAASRGTKSHCNRNTLPPWCAS